MYDLIKEMCKKAGITVSQLEEGAGITPKTLSSWSRSEPRLSSVAKVANYFGVSLDYMAARVSNANGVVASGESTALAVLSPIEQSLLTLFRQLDFGAQNILIGEARALALK